MSAIAGEDPDSRADRPGEPRLGTRWSSHLSCTRTGETAPLDEPATLSPAGAPWRVETRLPRNRGEELRRAFEGRSWGIWRYRELLPVADVDSRVDLGEGGTPLLRVPALAPDGIEVLVKEESGNPTGSFKARGLAVAVTRARELGAPAVRVASAGNAAIALSAYAAAAGLPAAVALPEETPETVERTCRELGARVTRSGETLVEARAALESLAPDAWDLSTFREPYRVEGKKTMGIEIAEQLRWELPDWIVYPTGGGTGIVGMRKAFEELAALELVKGPHPRFAVVQMAGCAPLVQAFRAGATEAIPWEDPATKVWGLRVPVALADFLVLDAVRGSSGTAIAVPVEEVAPTAARAARRAGLLVGPEGAAALRGAEILADEGVIRPGSRVVVLQTGHPANYR